MANRREPAEGQQFEERRSVERTSVADRAAWIEFPTGRAGRRTGRSLPVDLIEFSPRGASVRAPAQSGVNVGDEAILRMAGGVAGATIKAISPAEAGSCRYGLVFVTVDTYLRTFINDLRQHPDEHDYRWLYRSA